MVKLITKTILLFLLIIIVSSCPDRRPIKSDHGREGYRESNERSDRDD